VNALKKVIAGCLWNLERLLGVEVLLNSYRTMRLRRLLKLSHRGLHIQHPVVVAHPEKVSIGRDCSIAAFLHIWGGGAVTIGDRVLIASHVSIVSETHDYTQHPITETAVLKPVVIEDDVWLGTHCTVLPGVTVGRGAVIGAGAVVTKNVEPFSIQVGVPAKCVGQRPNLGPLT
jgi:acetyltransferase-like isoleucine patch superfamily enzyme